MFFDKNKLVVVEVLLDIRDLFTKNYDNKKYSNIIDNKLVVSGSFF